MTSIPVISTREKHLNIKEPTFQATNFSMISPRMVPSALMSEYEKFANLTASGTPINSI